jgi:hypothetical protein
VFRIPNSAAALIREPAESALTPLSTPVTIASTIALAIHESRSCFPAVITA